MASGYTQADLDVLKKHFAKGILKIEANGQKVEYRSLAELERAIATVQAGLDADAGTGRVRMVNVITGKGV